MLNLMKLGRLVCYLFFFVPSISAATTAYVVHCPEKITVNKQTAATVKGWQIFASEPNYYLNGVSLYSGKPEQGASLKPDTINSVSATWSFSATDQIYLACEYHQTNLQYAQPLSLQTRRCVVEYDKFVRTAGGQPLPKKIVCFT